MSKEEELAGRFFALWTEYLSAVMADPHMVEPARRWLELAAGALQHAAPNDGGAPGEVRPAAEAAPAAAASGERDRALVELSRRVDELSRRLDAVEQRAGPATRPRPRAKAARD